MKQGTIKKLTDRGFGFIDTGGGDLFFHGSVLQNAEFEDLKDSLEAEILPEAQYKKVHKAKRKQEKLEAKQKKKAGTEDKTLPRLFVLDFNGDVQASGVDHLRREITAILQVASQDDEVLVRLESPGGLVHSYGLASSQLRRIRNQGIKLTIAVDQVAASGGYMMACIADDAVFSCWREMTSFS